MSRTIAITGATGFIGSMLAKHLATTGWHTKALVRSASLDKLPKDTEIEWVTGDLEDAESLKKLVTGADAIVHCAGAVRGVSQEDFNGVNVDGVTRMVQIAASQNPLPKFLLISSLAAREPQLSFYAASKRGGEKVLASLSGNMFWGVLRPPAVYGPGDREMLPLFQSMFRGLAPVIGSDSNRVSLLYVEDLVDAIVSWLENSKNSKCFYELHDGHKSGYSWQEIIDVVERMKGKAIFRLNIPVSFVRLTASLNLMAAKVFGGSPMLTPGKVRELVHPDWVAENDQLIRETGWAPKVLLEEGLRKTLGSDI
jgi:nucleoside-diphosphate-sugar epimerase